MARRLFSIACVVFISSWMLLAIERATFILTDGERISGTVVFHGDAHENLINGFLNLGTTDGKEQTFRQDQVAVIDFIGGRPNNTELTALPDNGHLLALRNGTTRRGQFVNIIGGDTLRWRDENGTAQSMPITEVARVYLNPGSARNTFHFTSPTPAGTAGQTTQALEPAGNGETVVKANTPWNDTGIDVRRGETIRFSVRGKIMFGTDPSQTAPPDGSEAMKNPSYPVPGMAVGGLIARVGNGPAFPIGGSATAITMPANGRLMLGVNDDNFPDNSGAFYVTIVRRR
jgi:hypothetical protein